MAPRLAALGLSLGLLLLAAGSFGQAAQPLPSTALPATDDADAMVVTGSRIKRSAELASSAPVDILDHKALERTGAAYAGDLLQTLTAAQGSGFQGSGNPNNQGGGARGTVTVNLRGLGAGSTLVLLNSRRLTPTAGGADETLGDLGMIPLSAIERIEVLKGGGSAIYGADAVGGVVNIVNKNTWDGMRVELNGQNTTRFDQGDVTLSAGFGSKSEKARLAAAVSYLRRGELLSTLRPFAAAANIEQNGNPGTFIAPGLDPANPMRSRFVDPACGTVRGVHATVNGVQTADETCSFGTAPYTVLVGAQERANGFVSASYDVSPHATIFMELLASRMRQAGAFPRSFPIPPPLPIVPAATRPDLMKTDAEIVADANFRACQAIAKFIADDVAPAVSGAVNRSDPLQDICAAYSGSRWLVATLSGQAQST